MRKMAARVLSDTMFNILSFARYDSIASDLDVRILHTFAASLRNAVSVSKENDNVSIQTENLSMQVSFFFR